MRTPGGPESRSGRRTLIPQALRGRGVTYGLLPGRVGVINDEGVVLLRSAIRAEGSIRRTAGVMLHVAFDHACGTPVNRMPNRVIRAPMTSMIQCTRR